MGFVPLEYNEQVKMIKWKYCPQCKRPLDTSGEYPYCRHCDLTIYLASKPTAGVLIAKDNKVLLSKRGIEPYKGKYDILGGFLKLGEDPKKGAIREVKEETGLDVKLTHFIGVYIDRYRTTQEFTFNLYYVGEIVGGKMNPQDDVAELKWFSLDDLPEFAFKTQPKVLADFKTWYKNNSF